MKRGAVVNLEATVESIKKSVSEAEAMAKCEVEQVYVGLAGPHIRSSNSKGVTPIATRSREITGEDVKRVIETARAVALSPEREIIHIIPQEFTVDDQTGIADPHRNDRNAARSERSHRHQFDDRNPDHRDGCEPQRTAGGRYGAGSDRRG